MRRKDENVGSRTVAQSGGHLLTYLHPLLIDFGPMHLCAYVDLGVS